MTKQHNQTKRAISFIERAIDRYENIPTPVGWNKPSPVDVYAMRGFIKGLNFAANHLKHIHKVRGKRCGCLP